MDNVLTGNKKTEGAVNHFTTLMKMRLRQMEEAGYTGWDGPKPKDFELLDRIINDAVCMIKYPDIDKSVDIANRAMMLKTRRIIKGGA